MVLIPFLIVFSLCVWVCVPAFVLQASPPIAEEVLNSYEGLAGQGQAAPCPESDEAPRGDESISTSSQAGVRGREKHILPLQTRLKVCTSLGERAGACYDPCLSWAAEGVPQGCLFSEEASCDARVALQTALVLPLLQSSAGVAVAASFLSRFSGPSSSTPAAASSASLVEAAVAEGVANLEERYHAWSLANPGATATKGEFWVVSTPRRLHAPCVLRNSSMRSRYT